MIKKNKCLLVISVIFTVFIVLILMTGCSFKRKVGYGLGDHIIENNIEYQTNAFFKVARVSKIILTENNMKYEIIIPERLENGTHIEGFGHVSKGMEYFSFEMKNRKTTGYYGEIFEESIVSEYYVTIKFGENIKEADCIMYEKDYYIYKFEDTEEYFRINVEFQVSPDNEYYYSQKGIVYPK